MLPISCFCILARVYSEFQECKIASRCASKLFHTPPPPPPPPPVVNIVFHFTIPGIPLVNTILPSSGHPPSVKKCPSGVAYTPGASADTPRMEIDQWRGQEWRRGEGRRGGIAGRVYAVITPEMFNKSSRVNGLCPSQEIHSHAVQSVVEELLQLLVSQETPMEDPPTTGGSWPSTTPAWRHRRGGERVREGDGRKKGGKGRGEREI